MKTTAKLGARWMLVVCVEFAAACSTVGEKEFACPGRPPGVRCMSATEVYEATQTTDTVAATASKPIGDDPKHANDRNRRRHASKDSETQQRTNQPGTPEVQSQTQIDTLRTAWAPAVDKPIPIRTPAQVMRVWFAPWEDSRGALHAGGYAFIEVEARRWTFGEPSMTTEPVRFFSIQRNAVDTKESVGKDRSGSNERGGTSERVKRTSTLPKETSNESSAQERRK